MYLLSVYLVRTYQPGCTYVYIAFVAVFAVEFELFCCYRAILDIKSRLQEYVNSKYPV